MKKWFVGIALIIFLSIVYLLLNIPLSTQQCIDYSCQSIKLPLYLKTIDFFDRHYNYNNLVKRIVSPQDSKQDRMLKILQWTYANIRRQPKELPVVDDHVWHIIVRGYGEDDQFQDVFSTLCNYAGVSSFFTVIETKDKVYKKPMALLKLKRGWSIFDAYSGVYFINAKNEIADLNELKSGACQAVSLSGTGEIPDYSALFNQLESIDFKDWQSSRSAVQSPLFRLLFWNKNKENKQR